jgi:hypothetical protein
MKNCLFVLMAALAASCATVEKPASSSASQEESPNYIVVDYKDIAPENVEDYLKVERFWKPVHQERIDDGRMKAWLLLKVVNEGQEDQPYNFITLNVYPDRDKVSSGGATQKDWINAHGAQRLERDGQSMGALTRKVNNIISRELHATVSSTYSLTKYRRVNFMKAAPGQRDAFVESRLGFVQPIFMRMINDSDAPLSGWILNELVTAEGSDTEYDFVSYDLFKDKADLTRSNPGRNYTALAHPNLSNDEVQAISNQNGRMRKMVKREVWEVVDYAFKRASLNGVWSFSNNKYKADVFSNSVPLKIIKDGHFMVLHMKNGVINHVHTGSAEYDGVTLRENIRATSENEGMGPGKSFVFNIEPSPDQFIQLGKNEQTGADWKEQWMRATKNTIDMSGIEGVWVRDLPEADRIMVKYILDHTWAWVIMNTKTGLITNALGGTFELNAGEYIERSQFHFNVPNGIGGTLEADLAVDGNELSLEGIISRGGERSNLQETWKRFEWPQD